MSLINDIAFFGGVVACTDSEVVDKLLSIYRDKFSGKQGQRFLISSNEIRSLYGFVKLFDSRVDKLTETAFDSGLYLFDLGEGERGRLIAVIKSGTVNRWRRVPKKIIEQHIEPLSSENSEEEEDDE
ncbi:hypothetical protein ACEV6Q_26905 [Enterobacter ludwigii]|uniref:hypothetical protein n=1 Tax=Enterobacter ludwigii TaxID=299767 RepID=UPI003BEF40EA